MRGRRRGPRWVGTAPLALLLLAFAATAAGAREPAPASVVLYVIDTLRADHLGCYGYPRPTSPRIDAFARSAIRFTYATAQSSWTLPSIASILTARLPGRHGAFGPARAVRADVATLAGLLRDRGYTTAGFVTNYLGSGVFGLDRGFDVFRFYAERGDRRPGVYLDSDSLVRRVSRWLARGPREPFLLYVHATDPHFPYAPPPRYARPFRRDAVARDEYDRAVEAARPLHNGRERWGTRPAPLGAESVGLLRDAYDGDIRRADAAFGRLLDILSARGLLERSIVVLTSDHGEEFLEHGGVAHGQTLYAEALQVPLLVRLPGGLRGGTRIDAPAAHVDVLPTILDAVGLPVPSHLDGAPLLSGGGPREAHTSLRLAGRMLDAVATRQWKVIRDLGRPRAGRFEAYRLADDPGERRNVADDALDLVTAARERMRRLDAVSAHGPRVPDERLERLQALGYVTD